MSKPLKAFITYSHEDKDDQKRKRLRTCLAVMERKGEIKLQDDTDTTAGGKARQEDILKEVANSDILLYLVSADSLASENCNKELTEAVRFGKRVIPIILESCDWLYDRLSDFQALPDKGKPISKWDDESDGWQNVVDGIREAVEEMQTQPDSSSETSEREFRAESAFQHGNVLLMVKQIDMAIEAYSHAIDLNPNNASTYTNRGVAYYLIGDYDRAIKDFDKAIQLNPNDVKAYTNRGIAYGEKGDYDRALGDCSKAIELDPSYADAYNNRGNAYSDKGDYDRAIEDYTRAIALKPNLAEVYTNRGVAYMNKEDFVSAISDHTKAIELNPNYANAYNNRGGTYFNKGDFDRAIEDLTKAIQLNPHDAGVYTNRGNTYSKQGGFDRAIADYTKTIQLNPNDATSYHNRGMAHFNKGDFDRAIEDLTKAIQLNPHDAGAYNNRGNACYIKGDFDRAITDYTKVIALSPNNANAYYNRGVAYFNKGDFDRAIEDHTKTIALDPSYADAYNNRGVAYGIKGDFDRAIADYTKTIQLNPHDAGVYTNRGNAYSNKGDFDRAIADYTKTIQLNPHDANAYTNRGVAYFNKGDFDRAIEDYTKTIVLKPHDANAYTNRGIAYSDKGDFDRAITDYTKAIDLNPAFVNAYCNRGEAWLHLEEWDKARADLITARNMGVDIIAAFHNAHRSVEAYERANRVKLPEDIAAMLTQRRRSRFPKTEKLLNADGTPLESPDVLNLLAKLRNSGPPLSQYLQTRPAFGIKTGASGAFVVDSATRDQLIAEHPASADILKPFLHGQDIRRWQVESPVDKSRSVGDAWLIFTHRRIEIDRYPAIRKHLEQYRSVLSKRAGKQKWYELPTTKRGTELFTQTKLICPNNYNHQTFAVDTDGFYCGDTCYLIPTAETWLCGLLNSHIVEWFYSQTSNQLTIDYLRARSRHIQEIPIPDLTSTQKSLIGKIVDYLIFLQGQPTTRGGDLAHSRDFIILRYFERIIDGLAYESYLSEELHQGDKQFFKPLLDERLPQLEEIRGDKMAALRKIFEQLYERTHPVRRNLFFLDSVKPIRIIEDKA